MLNQGRSPEGPLMTYFSRRRTLTATLVTLPWLSACSGLKPSTGTDLTGADVAPLASQFAQLERSAQVRLGVSALDTANGARIAYRADERFPMCSLFKFLAAAAILDRGTREPDLLARRIRYRASGVLEGSPVTQAHLDQGMALSAICEAAIRYSDNTAGNLMLQVLGGPAAVTAYARTLGDSITRLDRNEPEVNTAFAGDERDTSTPAAMLADMQKILLLGALPAREANALQVWLQGSMLGAQRIRAGVPADWRVGDKTAGGINGANNDIAMIWPPRRPPILLTIFVRRPDRTNDGLPKVIADATKLVAAVYA